MHLERYGNEEVEGIEQGTTYVFPQLDGTNGTEKAKEILVLLTKAYLGIKEIRDG